VYSSAMNGRHCRGVVSVVSLLYLVVPGLVGGGKRL